MVQGGSAAKEGVSTTGSDSGEVGLDTNKAANNEKAVGRGWRWLALLLILLLLTMVAGVGWFGFQLYQDIENASELGGQQTTRINSITQQIETEAITRFENQEELAAQISAFELGLNTQARSIAELTTLDRDQWLIAELEYLVRLANQRLLTERRPQGALILLELADKLLHSLDAVGALGVRSVLARDITALRLVELVDREGIYSRLGALTPVVLSLTALPSAGLAEFGAEPGGQTDNVDATSYKEGAYKVSIDEGNAAIVTSWHLRLWSNTKAAVSRLLQNHFHVRYRELPVEPLVSNEQEEWLRHDMAINISNAQQALLREEQQIYKASLMAVENHLQNYFEGSHDTQRLMVEVGILRDFNIKQALPDISASIHALRQLQVAPSTASDVVGVQR